MHVFSTTTAHTHKTMSAFCTTRTKWNNACSPGKNEGGPLLELPTPAESAAHKPSSTCIATRITSKPTALWVRASPPTPPPSFDESHFLDSSSGWPSSPLPGNHPTKYCTDSTTIQIHQVPYQQHHIGSQLSLQPNGLPSHYESGTEAHSSAKCSLHAWEHHSSKTNLSNNLQHTHTVFHFRKRLLTVLVSYRQWITITGLIHSFFECTNLRSAALLNSHCLESKVTQQGFPQQRPRVGSSTSLHHWLKSATYFRTAYHRSFHSSFE